MLRSLSIQNYALIEKCEIVFDDGLSVMTGETGAGKSIIVGALGTILGARADSSILHDKERKCVVEGSFDVRAYGLEELFEEADLDHEEISTFRREILPKGRSRAFINDTPVRLEVMKGIGERLVDVHGQEDTLLLRDKRFTTRFLDAFADQEEELDRYQEMYAAYRTRIREWEELKERMQKTRSDEDYIRFQLNELDDFELDPERFSEEEEELKRLEHAETIRETLANAKKSLQEEEYGILDRLRELRDAFAELSELHSGIAELHGRLDSSYIELDDIGAELERMDSMEDLDPERVRSLREKQDCIRDLMHKHDVRDVKALKELREEFRNKLEDSGEMEEREKRMREELEEKRGELEKMAEALDRKRDGVREEVSSRAQSYLDRLGMADSRIEVELEEEEELSELGKSSVRLRFRPTPGAKPRELGKVASGGERSRVMLAMKALFCELRTLPTMILDEIDTGVSGEIAEKAGQIMKGMAEHSQVIAITHLPQIAGKGDHHFKVFKDGKDAGISTRIEALGEGERIEEIARMLSGEEMTKAAKEQAKELLDG